MSVACAEQGRRVQSGPPPFAGIGPKYLPPEGYNPRHDPDYVDHVVEDLMSHWGCWRRLHETVGGDFEAVRDAVEIARRLGFVVEGDRALGYRAVRFHRRRHLHAARACVWPLEEREEQDPGQLTLEGCPQ